MKSFPVFCLLILLLLGTSAHADLNAYIENLNHSARGNPGEFEARLGARFGVSQAQLEVVISSVDSFADAAIVLWLGEKSRQPRDRVLQIYREQKSQGWGAMAKSLGIKPGSAEFHALKDGNLDFHPAEQGGKGPTKGKGSGKHKKD
jgi:hypothetical protein